MLDYLRHPGPTMQRSPGPDPLVSRPSGDEAAAHLAEEVLDKEEVFAVLEAMRWEAGQRGARGKVHFGWTVLGGAWATANRAVAYDAFQARCQSAESKHFDSLFSMNTACRFGLTLFGEDASSVLCSYWVKKMGYFFELWEAGGSSDSFGFDQGAVEAFAGPADFTALANSATGQLLRRVGALRRLSPAMCRA